MWLGASTCTVCALRRREGRGCFYFLFKRLYEGFYVLVGKDAFIPRATGPCICGGVFLPQVQEQFLTSSVWWLVWWSFNATAVLCSIKGSSCSLFVFFAQQSTDVLAGDGNIWHTVMRRKNYQVCCLMWILLLSFFNNCQGKMFQMLQLISWVWIKPGSFAMWSQSLNQWSCRKKLLAEPPFRMSLQRRMWGTWAGDPSSPHLCTCHLLPAVLCVCGSNRGATRAVSWSMSWGNELESIWCWLASKS